MESQPLNLKRFFGILMVSLLICTCSSRPKEKYSHAKEDSFLALFPEIDPTDLHVYSPSYDPDIDDGKYQGKKIDTAFYSFLIHGEENPFEIDTFYHYYACYQFKLAEGKTGLLIRCPSQYSETAIRLYIWNDQYTKVSSSITLADAFGDEGWHFVQDAWIEDLNQDKKLDIVYRKKDYDMDLDNPKSTFQSDTTFVYLGEEQTFKQSDFKVNRNKYPLKYWIE